MAADITEFLSLNPDIGESTSFDQPPAYEEVQEAATSTSQSQFAVLISNQEVRICPHQTLPFSRLRRISTLPSIKTHIGLDALLPMTSLHSDRTPDGARICSPAGHENLDAPICRAEFRYKSSTSDPPRKSGFILLCTWAFGRSGPGNHQSSLTRKCISLWLSSIDIDMCPHRKIYDPWIVSAVYGLFHPGERYDDPIDQYLADQRENDNIAQCGKCDSSFEIAPVQQESLSGVKIILRRFLGEGNSVNERAWQAQCIQLAPSSDEACSSETGDAVNEQDSDETAHGSPSQESNYNPLFSTVLPSSIIM